MQMRAFQRHAAVVVGSMAAVTAMCAALAPTAGADDEFGAIAISDPHKVYGRSLHASTPSAAKSGAMSACGYSDCKVLTTFTACGAVAAKDHEYQGGIGPDLSAAMKDALSKLSGGYIDTWACN
jgi:hypothetical protein